MRSSVSMSKFTTSAVFVWTLLLPVAIHAADIHPVERHLRERFPSLALDSSASFDASDAIVNGRIVSGLRSHRAGALRVTYPRLYDEPLVAEMGNQRVVLRAVGARGAAAIESGGKLVYEQTYASTDAIEVPYSGRSEELLLLHDRRAPLIYEYEILEMQGIGAVVLDEGAVRFQPIEAVIPASAGRFSQPTPWMQIDRPWVIDSSGRRSDSHARWTLLRDGDVPKTLRLTVSAEGLSYPLVVDPSFSYAGSLNVARFTHTSTLLPNGLVLFAGGYDTTFLSSAELYDPARGTFTATAGLATARNGHTATPLPNGKVLIAGGQGSAGYLTSAELYDPATGTFSATGNLVAPRYNHTANLLLNGKVLLAGGSNDSTGYLTSAELYDPTTGTFSATGSLAIARGLHTATLLPNGKVLLAGGYNSNFLSSAEVYDPSSGMFSATGALATARYSHTATLLPNGKVLIAGGATSGAYVTSSELYDPSGAGSFSATGPLATGRYQHTATLLPNGKVLITGGLGGPVVSSTELYDSAGGTFSDGGNLILGRYLHTATMLASGKLLVAGGLGNGFTTSNVELYDYATGTLTATTGNPMIARQDQTATLLPNGKVLIVGGQNTGYLASAELYDPATGAFTPTGDLNIPRAWHTATLLTNGKVLIAGGYNNTSNWLVSAELYDPATGLFTTTGSLTTARYIHTAILLANGKVLIAGGKHSYAEMKSELYDPASGTFSATGNMVQGRFWHTATLLPNGKVLFAGGAGIIGSLSTAELYDSASGTFSPTGSLAAIRTQHSATLLPNGKVLIATGGDVDYMLTAELYDPASGTFSATGSSITTRGFSSTTVLPNGKVLIVGGTSSVSNRTLEFYEPASGTFSAVGSLTTNRYSSTSTLLTDGRVLIAGGYTGSLYVLSASLFDVGLGFAGSRRPTVTSAATALIQPGPIALSGSGFRGDSEGSSGGYNSSATNFPLIQLQRIDNDQTVFLDLSQWSDAGCTSKNLSTLANGPYRLTVFTNAIPSLQRIILITGVAPPSVPTLLSATATSASTVAVNWQEVEGAAAYEVYESEFGVGYALILTTTATSFTHTGLQAETTYLYKVRAVGNGGPSGPSAPDAATTLIFTDASLVGAEIRLVHILEVRRAVNAMRVAAGLTQLSYTDPMPMAGAATIKAVHMTELRLALDQARAAIGISPLVYTDTTITPGTTTVKAVHMTELRAGTQ